MDQTDSQTGRDTFLAMRNIGPAQADALLRAGVRDADMLREIGAHEAYRRLLAQGARPHFISYYVLHMALQGRPWNDCRGDEKTALRTAFDQLKSEMRGATQTGHEKGRPGSPGAALHSFFDRIGLIEP